MPLRIAFLTAILLLSSLGHAQVAPERAGPASIAVPVPLDVGSCDVPARPALKILKSVATPPPEGTLYVVDDNNSYSAIAALPAGGFVAVGAFNPDPRTVHNLAGKGRQRVQVVVKSAGNAKLRELELPWPSPAVSNPVFGLAPIEGNRFAILVRGWFDQPWYMASFDGARFTAWRAIPALPSTEREFRAFAIDRNHIGIEGLALRTQLSLPRGYRAEINIDSLHVAIRPLGGDSRTTAVSTGRLADGDIIETFSEEPFPAAARVVVSRLTSAAGIVWRRQFAGCDACVYPDAAYPTRHGFIYVASNQTRGLVRSRSEWDIAVGDYDADGNARSWRGFRFPEAFATKAGLPDSVIRIVDVRSAGNLSMALIEQAVGDFERPNSWWHFYWLITLSRNTGCRLVLDWNWVADTATVRTEAVLSGDGSVYFAGWGFKQPTLSLRGVWIGEAGRP